VPGCVYAEGNSHDFVSLRHVRYCKSVATALE
jgi:hypothetical protein